MIIGFIGMYFLSEGNTYGFLIIFVSVLLAFIVAIMANQYGFIIANLVNMAFALRGFFKQNKKGIDFLNKIKYKLKN